MNRTKRQNAERSEACRDYSASVGDACEIAALERRLKKCLVEPEDLEWMSRHRMAGVEVHHITSRSNNPLKESWCNLLIVSRPVHGWIETCRPAAGEILCLYVKMLKHQQLFGIGVIQSEVEEDWNEKIMDGLVSPHVTLIGHVHMLLAKVKGSIYYGYAERLLEWMD